MKELIEQLIRDKPRHFVFAVRADEQLHAWVCERTSHIPDAPLGERIYVAITGNNSVCSHGNSRHFKSFKDGYSFCGRVSVCQCCRDSVSKKCADAKNGMSDEEKTSSNSKREQTNMDRYGVSNTGQTDVAKAAHKAFYENPENINRQLMVYRQSMVEKYGVSNPIDHEEIAEKRVNTLLERYGTDNPMRVPAFAHQSVETRKEQIAKGSLLRYGYARVVEYLRKHANMELLTSITDYKGVLSNQVHEIKCISCNTVYSHRIDYGNIPVCRICNPLSPSYRSRGENELYDYISSLGVDCRRTDRRLISPYEIDLVIDDAKVAIEYSGLYWHSQVSGNKDRMYHQKKMKLAADKGYRLLTIFDDEWNSRRDIVKTVLAHILQNDGQRLFARKCTITTVDNTLSKAFYDTHHLMGHGSAFNVNLALEYNGNVVAMMSFVPLRSRLKKQITGSSCWELTRFAAHGTVVGGASKLLSAFIREYAPTEIVSYADARWSQGNLYEVLGFRNEGLSEPRYWYTKNYLTRLHRFSFRKDQLIKNGADPLLSEWEIMQSQGYDRVWDCGRYRYVWSIRSS